MNASCWKRTTMNRKLFLALFLGFVPMSIPVVVLAAGSPHDVITAPYQVIPLVVLGFIVGNVGTLIGAGGGFIIVPLLMILYGFSPQHAIGTSMVVVFLNALSGTFAYMAQKRIDYELGIKFSVFAVPGVVTGAFAAQSFNVTVFSVLFAFLLLLLAYSLIFVEEFYLICENSGIVPKRRMIYDAVGKVHVYSPDVSIGYAGSLLVGIISGLFGIGGGLIHVPLMSFLGIPIHIAAATSHFMIVITSFFGVLIFAGLKTIDIDYAIFLGVGSIAGAYFGAKLALLTRSNVIKKVIASILVLVVLKLVIGVV